MPGVGASGNVPTGLPAETAEGFLKLETETRKCVRSNSRGFGRKANTGHPDKPQRTGRGKQLKRQWLGAFQVPIKNSKLRTKKP